MSWTWLKPALLPFALLLAIGAGPGPAAGPPAGPAASAPGGPTAGPAADEAPHPGELLVASAAVQDPRFYHAVILILRHDPDGAFGIVINHPLEDSPVAGLLAALGDKRSGARGMIPIVLGGPVAPDHGFVVHSADYHGPGTLVVDSAVAMTPTRAVLYDIGHGKGPARRFFAIGYTGWGAGQLDGEIARHDWFTAPGDPALVFTPDRATIWTQAYARREQQL